MPEIMRLSDDFISSGSRLSTGRRRRCGLPLLTLVFILTCHLVWPTAMPATQAGLAAVPIMPEEKDVTSFRIKIRRLQQGIANQETQIAESEAKERNILEEMEIIDSKLAKQQEKLKDLEGKMQKQQALIDQEEDTLKRIRKEKAGVEEHLKKRITAYYTMGDIGLLNVTFSTQTLPELLTFHDAFDALIKYDQKVFQKYLETINEIERTKTALDLEKGVLQEFIKQLVEENEILGQTKNDKQLLLTHVRTKAKLNKQAIDEMQRASEDLSRSIVSIKSKRQVFDQGFTANKGSLPPPVDGVLITLFDQEKVNKLGIARKSQGIELKAPDGTRVIAVAEGEVIFSGYLRGYGNTVIIHHGLQYYTVTARIEKLLVEKGQQLKAESSIGIMGDTAVLFDEGLYFEIRHGRESLDPLIWLNPNRLSAQHEHAPEPDDTAGSVQ